MKDIKPHYADDMLKQLPSGAFLTVKDSQGRINTMTIGWGSMGFIWGKPVFMVMVRPSRYTFQLMENSDNFTVSLPLRGQLSKELNWCGTSSGRHVDKFSEYGLRTLHGREVASPVIGGCDIYYECRILFKQQMTPQHLAEAVNKRWYVDQDYHMLYFGEVVACYQGGS